jgi:hypothetical protein
VELIQLEFHRATFIFFTIPQRLSMGMIKFKLAEPSTIRKRVLSTIRKRVNTRKRVPTSDQGSFSRMALKQNQ